MGSTLCEEAQMTEQGCRALETEEKILAIDGVDSFILTLDLDLDPRPQSCLQRCAMN